MSNGGRVNKVHHAEMSKMMVVRQYTKDGSIYRPDIIWKAVWIKCGVGVFVTILVSAILCFFIKTFQWEYMANRVLDLAGSIIFLPGDGISPSVFMLTLTIACVARLKHLLIFAIYLYQKYAPESIRSSCRFTPSCSHYMILALEKYGAVMGIIKGFRRLLRCHAPNGGCDYP